MRTSHTNVIDARARVGRRMRLMSLVCCVVLFMVHAGIRGLHAQCTQADFNDQLKTDLQNLLSQFLACSPDDPSAACNVFLAKAVKRAYGINDFIQNPDGPGDPIYMIADVIAVTVRNNDKWTDLGAASDQGALDKAQQAANCNKAVLAVQFNNNGPGHVALVLPGTETASGNWELNVPNSASFFLNHPEKAYVGKGLSFAYQTPDDVELYARNTP